MAQNLDKFESLLARLENAVTRIEKAKGGSSTPASGSGDQDAERVTALDQWYNESYKPWLDKSNTFGKPIADAAKLMQTSFDNLRRIVKVASLSKKPSDPEFGAFIQDFGKLIMSVEDFAAKNRGDFYDHLKGISEGAKAFTWIASPTAVTHVKESIPSVQFYTNKVLVKYRKTDQAHVDWVNGCKKWQEDLQAYVKEHHATGLAWNPQGKDLKECAASTAVAAPAPASSPKAAPSSGAPPPPPPAPKNEELYKDIMKSSQPQGNAAAALFDQINSGNVTSGLRKVQDEEKSKNRKDRTGLVTSAPKKFGKREPLGPPKFELQEKKWVIENQDENQGIVIENPDMKHTVYVSKCRDSLIQIKGKVNTVILDGCTKTGVVFDNVVASIEVVNCKSVQLQVTGRVPTVIVDKTDGCQIILSNNSLDTVIITSKSSEMNVCVPKDDEYDEVPIPEQFETRYNIETKKFVTVATSHASA